MQHRSFWWSGVSKRGGCGFFMAIQVFLLTPLIKPLLNCGNLGIVRKATGISCRRFVCCWFRFRSLPSCWPVPMKRRNFVPSLTLLPRHMLQLSGRFGVLPNLIIPTDKPDQSRLGVLRDQFAEGLPAKHKVIIYEAADYFPYCAEDWRNSLGWTGGFVQLKLSYPCGTRPLGCQKFDTETMAKFGPWHHDLFIQKLKRSTMCKSKNIYLK